MPRLDLMCPRISAFSQHYQSQGLFRYRCPNCFCRSMKKNPDVHLTNSIWIPSFDIVVQWQVAPRSDSAAFHGGATGRPRHCLVRFFRLEPFASSRFACRHFVDKKRVPILYFQIEFETDLSLGCENEIYRRSYSKSVKRAFMVSSSTRKHARSFSAITFCNFGNIRWKPKS